LCYALKENEIFVIFLNVVNMAGVVCAIGRETYDLREAHRRSIVYNISTKYLQ